MIIHYPKVFILLEPFNNYTGMGITLTNLFQNWPKENIAIAANNLDIDLCERIRPCHSYIVLSATSKGVENSKTKTSLLETLKCRTFLKFIYHKIGGGDLRKLPVTNDLLEKINNFHPDIIFTALGSLDRIKFVEEVMAKFPYAKLAIYVVDDWPNTKQNGRWFPAIWKKIYDKSLKRLLDKTTYFLSICPTMSDSYILQYGKEFIPFHNPVDTYKWDSITPIRHYPNDVFSIVYVGKINRDTKENLMTLAAIIDSLNKRGVKARFDVYTPSIHDDIDTTEYVGFNIIPPISNDKIPATLKGYDALYLTLGFSKESRAYTRLSMPTKLTEYLAAGVPILLYAPSEIAVSKYVRKTNTGLVCGNDSEQALEDAILQLINNPNLCDTLKSNALELAKAHDIKLVRNEFRETLSKWI